MRFSPPAVKKYLRVTWSMVILKIILNFQDLFMVFRRFEINNKHNNFLFQEISKCMVLAPSKVIENGSLNSLNADDRGNKNIVKDTFSCIL